MLDLKTLPLLKHGKNLLAFSGGVDSSALFFLLLEAEIPFSIALVNYHTREQSHLEASYAKALAKRFNKECFIYNAHLEKSNFEASARQVRYNFFETLCQQHDYANLITAHQLDDRLEWFLMQFSKGAGLYELIGMQSVETWKEHTLIRPLLQQSKASLLSYLQERNIRYFMDESNQDVRYKRNHFRHEFSTPLLKQYESGIRESFHFLQEDSQGIYFERPNIVTLEKLFYFHTPDSRRMTLLLIDKTLKIDGFLMRQGDKNRLKKENELVVGRRYSVSITPTFTFISPYESAIMTKPFKEKCRKLQIAPAIRPYLYNHLEVFETLKKVLERS
ncbi:MAG: tRNA lysidine(34) synthetase TilS [Epsilonproteobacteria bacterium]|nr:MAG: tRNA lysidine(34) synthetase TilS [Campylobacterota bacterium]